MTTNENYQRIAEEISLGRQDPAIWARALAESGGDSEKTKALYIRRRVAMVVKPQSVDEPAEEKLRRLRSELRRQLALQRKHSLYAVIGVSADASDADVAEAIGGLAASGQPLDAEARYAAEILGNSEAREQFDRQLLEQLNPRQGSSARPVMFEQHVVVQRTIDWQSWLGGALLLMIAGYLGLAYTKEKSDRELRLKEVEARNEEIRLKAKLEEQLVENKTIATEAAISFRERAIESQERAAQEARLREDRQRNEQSFRQEQQLAQAEQRRLQNERANALADARRRDAQAQAETRTIRQQAILDAMARGNYNEAQRLRNQQY